MYDIVGKIWAFIFGSIVIFLGTITLFAQKQDTVIQNYVDSAAEEFVDVARATGNITQSGYEKLVAQLDATGNVYEIRVIHYEERVTPVHKEGGEADDFDYEIGYEARTKDDILNIIYNGGGKYRMKTGDFLRVSIKNVAPTLGRRLAGLFIGPSDEGGQIIASYGGYVGNEE